METPDVVVDEKEAARFLGIAPATLRKMRSLGPQSTGLRSIPYFRMSPKCVRYSMADLQAYRESFRVDPAGDAA